MDAIAPRVADFRRIWGRAPGLAVILVGDDSASATYVGRKEATARERGFFSRTHRLARDVEQAELLGLIEALNHDAAMDAILVQLPLPGHLDEAEILAAISPAKDVDGFHVVNSGLLVRGLPALTPCTPKGCMLLIREARSNLAGLNAVVIGRSNIVGKPMAHLLLSADCTVTVAHSKTCDLPVVTRAADILIAAAGRAEMVRGDWIKPGAIVIDVGINRRSGRIVGDVCFNEAQAVAGFITPVPGGVGPMTIACLLDNTLAAATAAATAKTR
ncbi:methylenetetrahydrofolate dehydrogenase [alpha proteobacterium U9-1i]|nr:methylenetetrahydrofolate dehydrogenase [alpha proteobacterium U9-1i]